MDMLDSLRDGELACNKTNEIQENEWILAKIVTLRDARRKCRKRPYRKHSEHESCNALGRRCRETLLLFSYMYVKV